MLMESRMVCLKRIVEEKSSHVMKCCLFNIFPAVTEVFHLAVCFSTSHFEFVWFFFFY